MNYEKQALSFKDQADRLISRGLHAPPEELIRRLEAVSYYRLSGYLFPFRQNQSDQFLPETTLTKVWDRYCFDRRLRVLLLDAIERVEVAVRTQLVYLFTHAHGPFAYTTEENFPNLKVKEYIDWRASLISESSRSKEPFTKHFYTKYGDSHKNLPLWMLSELMSMGSLLTFYRGVDKSIRSDVARHFNMPEELLLTWLRSLYAARNLCAHHARLWNRTLGYAPGLPHKNKFPDWHIKDATGKNLLTNNRSGILIFICLHFLRQISPTSCWKSRIEELFLQYPEIPFSEMGWPSDWQSHPLWQ